MKNAKIVNLTPFQSPYGDFGTLTRGFYQRPTLFYLFQSPYGDFGTLTRYRHFRCVERSQFQSPYGDFGTLTLSSSTRSQTGLTGDFFKPPAFLVFFGDPGEK